MSKPDYSATRVLEIIPPQHLAAMEAMPVAELRAMQDAMTSLGDIAQAFHCQPRFTKHTGPKGSVVPSEAANILEDVINLLATYATAAAAISTAAEPVTANDAHDKAWTLLQYHANNMADNLPAFVALAAEMARDWDDARDRDWIKEHTTGKAAQEARMQTDSEDAIFDASVKLETANSLLRSLILIFQVRRKVSDVTDHDVINVLYDVMDRTVAAEEELDRLYGLEPGQPKQSAKKAA